MLSSGGGRQMGSWKSRWWQWERAEWVPSLKLQPHTRCYRMFWLLPFLFRAQYMKNSTPPLPHKGKHLLHCEDAVCRVLGLCSAGWESRVAFPHTAWEWAGRESSSHESCAQVYKTEKDVSNAVSKMSKNYQWPGSLKGEGSWWALSTYKPIYFQSQSSSYIAKVFFIHC